MTTQIYNFSSFLNARRRAARKYAMTFTVSIEPENIRSGMRLLSRLFPEMSPLESDASVLFSRADFNKAAKPVTGIIQYGAPFWVPEKALQVILKDNQEGEQPLFAITSTKPNNDSQMVLPTSWGGGGPYIVVSDFMIVTEPTLLAALKEYSASQQSSAYEPLRSKIARAMDGRIIVKDDSAVAIPTMTLGRQESGLSELRIR